MEERDEGMEEKGEEGEEADLRREDGEKEGGKRKEHTLIIRSV